MNTNCNTQLPDNAINVTDVVPGMHIKAAYSPEQGIVKSVTSGWGQRVQIKFEGQRRPIMASTAGTFRLVDVPDGYSYHNGHGCIHDW